MYLIGVDPDFTDTTSRMQSLTGDSLTKLLADKEAAFDNKFEKVCLGTGHLNRQIGRVKSKQPSYDEGGQYVWFHLV